MSGGAGSAPGGESPFGKPLDPALLLEPAHAQARPLPVRPLAALFIPAAAMAAAALWQKLNDGPLALGDIAGRWLLLSALIGAALGALAGPLLASRALARLAWALWGALSPLLVMALIVGGVAAAHPLREQLAERAAAKCRLTRKVCSLNEFRARCTAAGSGPRALERASEQLGPPLQTLCSGDCTHRWLYAGPWTPDNWVAPGSVYCSLVVDADGAARRSALLPGPEVP